MSGADSGYSAVAVAVAVAVASLDSSKSDWPLRTRAAAVAPPTSQIYRHQQKKNKDCYENNTLRRETRDFHNK